MRKKILRLKAKAMELERLRRREPRAEVAGQFRSFFLLKPGYMAVKERSGRDSNSPNPALTRKTKES